MLLQLLIDRILQACTSRKSVNHQQSWLAIQFMFLIFELECLFIAQDNGPYTYGVTIPETELHILALDLLDRYGG